VPAVGATTIRVARSPNALRHRRAGGWRERYTGGAPLTRYAIGVRPFFAAMLTDRQSKSRRRERVVNANQKYPGLPRTGRQLFRGDGGSGLLLRRLGRSIGSGSSPIRGATPYSPIAGL